jgi:hypothetical protein
MEYVPDGSLADAIRPGPNQQLPLPIVPALAADLVGQVAEALQYTHERGVVHRDVKPGNILARRTSDGQWRLLLADFGIAKAMQEAHQKTQVSGTLAYMAPEQFSGTYSPATDQYALGVVAYQLLAGRPPFEGDLATVTQAQLNQPPAPIRTFNPAISPAVEAVILRSLAKRPGDRYPSMAAFATALREAAAQPMPVSAPDRKSGLPPKWPVPESDRPRTPGLARAWLAVMAAIILLVGAVIGADILHMQSGPGATATRTAQAGATTPSGPNPATATAQAQSTQTAVAAIATETAAAYIPTASATAGLADDVTAPPPAPAQANAIVFADAAPTCHGGNPPWQVDNATMVTCPSGGGVEIRAQTAGTLACIEQHTVPSDAYVSVLVTPQGSGGGNAAIVGFRQGVVTVGTPTPNVQQLSGTGYYYALERQSATYELYQYDAPRHRTILASGALPSGPAADFALGVLVSGSQITLYVNGQSIVSPIANSLHPQGWISICTNGDVVFKDVQVYNLKS